MDNQEGSMSNQSIKMFRAVFENSPVGLVLVNRDTTLRSVNNYMFDSFKLSPTSVDTKRFGNMFNCATVSGKDAVCGELDECRSCGLRNGVTMVLSEGITIPETVISHRFIINGTEEKKWFKISASRVDEAEDSFGIVSFVDISIQKEYEELLNSQLSLDMATGATNKHALLNALKQLTASREDLVIAMIDFDDFKNINDRYGHITGDRVLEIFCDAAATNTRKQDIVGRFGGEEFMLVLPKASAELLIKAVQRIYHSFQNSCYTELGIQATFSTGIAEYSYSATTEMDVAALIQVADENLYLSKKRGKKMITINGNSIPY